MNTTHDHAQDDAEPTVVRQRFVSADELGLILGVSASSVRLWVREGRVMPTSYIKMGNTYRFEADKVIEDLRSYEARTDADENFMSEED